VCNVVPKTVILPSLSTLCWSNHPAAFLDRHLFVRTTLGCLQTHTNSMPRLIGCFPIVNRAKVRILRISRCSYIEQCKIFLREFVWILKFYYCAIWNVRQFFPSVKFNGSMHLFFIQSVHYETFILNKFHFPSSGICCFIFPCEHTEDGTLSTVAELWVMLRLLHRKWQHKVSVRKEGNI
jgi:hypothetical protein